MKSTMWIELAGAVGRYSCCRKRRRLAVVGLAALGGRSSFRRNGVLLALVRIPPDFTE